MVDLKTRNEIITKTKLKTHKKVAKKAEALEKDVTVKKGKEKPIRNKKSLDKKTNKQAGKHNARANV